MSQPPIESRRQMADLLEERMRSSYADLRHEGQLRSESSLVKTYLVEAHLSEDAAPGDVMRLLKNRLSELQGAQKRAGRVQRTAEDFFFKAEMKVQEHEVALFVDATNPRFWFVHSASHSVPLDWLVARLVVSPQLDRAWLSAGLLEDATRLGSFRGLSLDYDRRQVPDVDFDADDAPVEFLKMQLWGNKAADILRLLRGAGAFPNETTLSKVKIKHSVGGVDEAEFSLDDIKFNGKITARGTSFQSHMALVTTVYKQYAGLVRDVEERFRESTFNDHGRVTVGGEPVNFFLSQPIPDLGSFCEHVFASRPPFRLWGVPVFLAEDFARISAVDLHVGARIDFEVGKQFVRLFLRSGGCGNSVLRFFSNLQRHYDANVEARDGDDNGILR